MRPFNTRQHSRQPESRTPVVPKVCVFCAQKVLNPEPEDADALRRFLSPQVKILPRRKTGTCAKHQRRVANAIKRAREMGYLSYTGQRR